VKDVLLLVDVVNDFEHDDGDALLTSFRARHATLVGALDRARRSASTSSTRTTTGAGGTAMHPGSFEARSNTAVRAA
jgi:hypothetical protein